MVAAPPKFALGGAATTHLLSGELLRDGMTPSDLGPRFFILSPGDGFCVQVFHRRCRNQLDRFYLRLGFDRPGLGDLIILHPSHLLSVENGAKPSPDTATTAAKNLRVKAALGKP